MMYHHHTNSKGFSWNILAGLLVLYGTIILPLGCSKSVDAAEEILAPSVHNATTSTQTAQIDKVAVYYFHNTRRCATCLGIQKVIEETVEGKFSKEINAGMLVFEELNMEEDDNKKYVEQFQLSFSTMIVAAQAGAITRKWENAEDVWEFAHEPDKLKGYAEKLIRSYLDNIGKNI